MKKGISPVVASVILIAVSVSIGVMVSTWITHLIEQEISQDELCSINTNYIIESAKFNLTGNNTLWLKIKNNNEQSLYGFGVIMDNGTQIIIMNSSHNRTNQAGFSATNKLLQQQSFYFKINLTNTTEENIDYQAFGFSLTTSSNTDVVVTNDACKSVASEGISTITTT